MGNNHNVIFYTENVTMSIMKIKIVVTNQSYISISYGYLLLNQSNDICYIWVSVTQSDLHISYVLVSVTQSVLHICYVLVSVTQSVLHICYPFVTKSKLHNYSVTKLLPVTVNSQLVLYYPFNADNWCTSLQFTQGAF